MDQNEAQEPESTPSQEGPPPADPSLVQVTLQVQVILNEMVWKHGGNLYKRPDFLELLKAYGLEKSDVSKAMFKHAEKEARKRAAQLAEKKWTVEENQKLIWMPEPDEDILPSGRKLTIWESKCGRYRVFRFMNTPTDVEYAAQYRTPEATWDIWEHSKEGPGYPKYTNSLETALVAVEKFHEKETGVPILLSNRQEVLEEEIKRFPKIPILTPERGPQMTSEETKTQHTPSTRGSRNEDLEQRILAVLDVNIAKSPKQIKIDAGIDLSIGINSTMKRLGKENKVIVGYGAYKLHPSMVKTTPVPATKEVPEQELEKKEE